MGDCLAQKIEARTHLRISKPCSIKVRAHALEESEEKERQLPAPVLVHVREGEHVAAEAQQVRIGQVVGDLVTHEPKEGVPSQRGGAGLCVGGPHGLTASASRCGAAGELRLQVARADEDTSRATAGCERYDEAPLLSVVAAQMVDADALQFVRVLESCQCRDANVEL